MVITKEFINIRCRYFSCGDRPDHCSRPGNTVASCKDAGNILGLNTAPAHGINHASLNRDSLFLKFFRFNSLANGHDHNITGETYR